MVYEYNISSNLDDREPFDILLPLPEIYDNIKPLDVKDTAIHIVYENTNNSAEKAALTKYCDFLYLTTKNPTFDYKNNPTVNMATKKNPKIKVHNYKEIAPITGMTPRKIMPDKKKKRETPIGFVYSTEDIASIFDIDFNTAINLMDISNTSLTDEDMLIQLSDGMANKDGIVKLEQRQEEYEARFNKKLPPEFTEPYLEIKAYFDKKLGFNLYELFPSLNQNSRNTYKIVTENIRSR